MKILLTGATGLLGKQLVKSCPKGFELFSTSKQGSKSSAIKLLDITKLDSVLSAINKIKPDLIIHTASLGNVDYCQSHQKEAWLANVLGTQNLLHAAKSKNAKFIFFSTNAVFDGNSPPYTENSPVHPLNYYGKTKVEAEKLVSGYIHHSIIFRLTTMYGWPGPHERANPATWIIAKLKQNRSFPVVTDVYNNHLWVGQAADCVWRAVAASPFGKLFHIAGRECVSRYEFACRVAEAFNLNQKLLIPVTSSYFRNLSPRAKNTCFATTKMEKQLKVVPLSIKAGLKFMFEEKNA